MAVLVTPTQLGPMTLMPRRTAVSFTLSCRARPFSPVSAKPALSTITCPMPRSPISSSASATASAGTMTTARSTPPGTSATRR